jgi:glycosyltransferase involved in cell wall biosynthesis
MAPDRSARRPRLLFLVTEDWYFCSHRLPIARAARDAGFSVTVATRVTDHGDRIRAEGFDLMPLGMERANSNPLREILSLIEITQLYRRTRPDIVHHVAVKPALVGSLAARFAGVPCTVNAIAGLGYVFASDSLKAKLLRPMISIGFRALLNGPRSRVIVQNPDDRQLLAQRRLVTPERMVLIKGSGVDLARFHPRPESKTGPAAAPVAALVSRMIWDKGIGVLVAAARILKTRGVALRVVLAGRPDPENPASIPERQLRLWHDEGIVEWVGFCDDVAGLWARSHIAVLPSWYGEGVPKSLLEAAACGRPLVAADGPGLREVVQDGITGILIPPRDASALADALQRLAEDEGLRNRLGQAARALAEREFGDAAVIRDTLELYRTLLKAGNSD